MNRRQLLKLIPPALASGLAGCTGGDSQSGDSGDSEPTDTEASGDENAGQNQNQRYGLPPCDEADRLVRVRGVSVDYRGLVQDNYNYLIKVTVEASGTEELAVRIKSGEVVGPNGDQITDFTTTQTFEFSTTATHTFEFEANTDTQYDASELSVDSLVIQAMPLDDWEMDDSVEPLRGTDNQGCY